MEREAYYSGTRFIDNEDGTVIDRLTGLMWMQNPQMCGAGSGVTWQGAFSCINIFNSLSLAGYDDWRFPNVREMQRLVDYGSPTDFSFTPFENVDLDYYWFSTSFFWFPEEQAYAVFLGDPSGRSRVKTNYYHAWPVLGDH